MKKYRVGIIGLGRMGSTIDEEFGELETWRSPTSIAGACEASDRLEVVAGSDLLPEKRSAFTEKWGVAAVYEDCMEMIEKEEPGTGGHLHGGHHRTQARPRGAAQGLPG